MVLKNILKMSLFIFLLSLCQVIYASDFVLTKSGESFPLWFETSISDDFKRFIIDDLNLVLQHVRRIEIKTYPEKLITTKTGDQYVRKAQTTLAIEGPYQFRPKKLKLDYSQRDLLGRVKIHDDKKYILISKVLIEYYKDIYQKREYYKRQHKELTEFIDFLNNIGNIDIDDMPDIIDINWKPRSNKNTPQLETEDEIRKQKTLFRDQFQQFRFSQPPLINMYVLKNNHRGAKGKLLAGVGMKNINKRDRSDIGLVFVKDDGKWKLGIELME